MRNSFFLSKKGVFNLKEMKYFKELKQDTPPNFKAVNTENEDQKTA